MNYIFLSQPKIDHLKKKDNAYGNDKLGLMT